MTINTTTLPQNIQTAIARFEQEKATYTQLQERLGNLHQKLEKHRKSAAATKLQAEQLGTQWREAFRQNDGELTKEIRAMKNGEIEAREFAEEYTNLVNTLTPEFELCQLNTVKARISHLNALKDLQQLYADYQFTASAEKLFSLPEAKPFLSALNYKISEISSSEQIKTYKQEIADDNMIENIIATKEKVLIIEALKPFIEITSASYGKEDGLNQYAEIEKLTIELDRYSPAKEQHLNSLATATIQ